MSTPPSDAARIRSAGVADLEVLLALREAALPGISPQEHERALRARLAGAAGAVLLAQSETGEPAGMLEADVSGDVARLHTLFVNPRHRRRGVARGLLDTAAVQLLAAGAHILTLELPLHREHDAQVLGLGFVVSDRLVQLQRPLTPAALTEPVREHARVSPRQSAEETVVQAAAALRHEPVLVIHPPTRRRWSVLHLLMAVAALLCLFNTNLFSPDPVRGGLLPILDVFFVIYFGVVLVNWRYRRRTDASVRMGDLFEPGPDDV